MSFGFDDRCPQAANAAALFICLSLGFCFAPSAAQAQCVQNGQTVTCSNNVPGGFQAGVDNLNVIVQPGATLTDNGTNAVGINNGSSVTNNGTVTAGSNFAAAIQAGGTNNLIINNQTINVSGFAAAGVVTGDSNTVVNAGTINLADTTAGMFIGSFSSVTNSGVIQRSAGAFQIGIQATDSNTIANTSSITLGNQATGGIIIGDNNVVINSGKITLGNNFNDFPGAIQATGSTGSGNTITNTATGTITVGNNQTGIVAVGSNNAVTNNGTITAGKNGFGIDTGQFVFAGGANNSVVNAGTITVGVNGTGILIENGGTVFNSGTINAATGFAAIEFCSCGANNVLTLAPTSAITGFVIGTGTDTLRLGGQGTGTFDISQISALFSNSTQYSGFTTFQKVDTSNWILIGTGSENWSVLGGTLTINGTLNGQVVAQAGTVLKVNGLINGPVTINGGTLGGNGTVGSTTINGGTLSPGNSIGLITINGNLTFAGAGNYLVEVSGTSADKTVVTGNATLTGATVQTAFLGLPLLKQYTILTAQGGLNGTTFSGVNGTLANFNISLSYTTTDVILNLTAALGTGTPLPPNANGVASAINTIFNGGGTLPTGVPNIFNLTGTSLSSALSQLSGEVHASTAGVLLDESLYVRSAILGRLRQASYGGDIGTMGSMAALRLGGPQAFAGDLDLASVLAYAKSPIVTKAPIRPPEATSDIVFWGQGFGAWGRFNGDGNAASVTRSLGGFISGVDTRAGANGRVGLAAGYTGSQYNLDGLGSANVDTGHVAAYGGWGFGALNLRGGAAYAFHTIATDRMIVFPGFFDRAFANYDGGTGQVFGEAGYGFALANLAVEPFAGAAWVHVHTDSGVERAMAAGLNFAAANFEVGYSTLGIRAASLVPLGNGMVLIPRASLAWQHAFGNVTPSDVLAFQATPTIPFTVSGVPIARDAALVEAGLDLAINAHATVGVSYTGQLARNVADHAAKGKFSWKF